MKSMQVFAALVWKDVIIEFRGRYFLWTCFALGILLIVLVGMALDGSGNPQPAFAAGFLWLTILFASAVSFNRHDAKDREWDAWSGMVLAPIDRSLIFYTKWFSTFILLFVVDMVVSGAFFIILNAEFPKVIWLFVAVVVLGTASLSAVGTFVSSLAAHTTMRDVLTPILLFPLSIPLFLAVVRLTVFSLLPHGTWPWVWAEVLCAYLLGFTILPWLLFEPLMEA